MTSDGSNFNDFPENQLAKCRQFKEYRTKVNRDHAFFCSKQNFHVIFTKFLKLSNYTLSQPLDNLSFRTGALCLSQICIYDMTQFKGEM